MSWDKTLLSDIDYYKSKNKKQYKKVFMTVGTTRFDLLCEYVDHEDVFDAFKELGVEEVVFQVGNSKTPIGTFEKNGIKYTKYRFKDSIKEDILAADLIVSHAGAGTCMEVLEAKKPLMVVVNETLMDNHQKELAEQLQMDGHLVYSICDALGDTLQSVDFRKLIPLPPSNPNMFYDYLDAVFQVQATDDTKKSK